MGTLEAAKERLLGRFNAERVDPTKHAQPQAADPTTSSVPVAPNLDSEVAATLGGANAEPAMVGPSGPIDVVGILDDVAEKIGGGLEWRDSITDMLNILGLEASLDKRRELAGELGYAGDTADVATMDTWLHKALVQELAEYPGKAPV